MLDRAGQEFSGGNLQRYIDPYRENVINVQARRINEDFDSRLSDLSAKRGMMDAFGSDRGTLLETELQKQRSGALRDVEETGLSTAFNQARESFFADRDSALRTAQAGGALDTQEMENLARTGSLERGVDQATRDFDYGQFLERRDWDLMNFEPLLAAINTAGAHAGSTSTQTTKTKQSTGAMLTGLASSIAGVFMGGLNPFAGFGSLSKAGVGEVPGSVGALGGPAGPMVA